MAKTNRYRGDPDRVQREVTAITGLHPAYVGYHNETPPELRPHPGPVQVGTVVYVHGVGRWRPGLVTRISPRLGRVVISVVHSTPANPTRMYRKTVQLSELRVRA